MTTRDIADYERTYDAHGFEAVQARFRKRLLLELLERLRPARVLEVGCGLDTLANHWTSAAQFTVVEPGPSFAAEARRSTAGRPEVTVIEASLETVAATLANAHDLILVSGLLHEVVDDEGLLRAVARLCRPDTVVHVNVPNARSFHRLLALEMGLIQSLTDRSAAQHALQQHRTFTLERLVTLAEANGFRILERGSYFVKPFTHAQMQALQADGLMTPAMLEGLWGMAKHLPEMGSEIFVNLALG